MKENNRKDGNRRMFLRTLMAIGAASMAGCFGGGSSDEIERPQPDDGEEDNYEQIGTLEYIGIDQQSGALQYEMQEMAVEQIRELGVDINLNVLAYSALAERWLAFDYDMLTLWQEDSADKLDGHFPLYFNYHSDFSRGDGENCLLYESTEYDNTVDNFIDTVNLDERVEAGMECQELLKRDQPVSYVFHRDTSSAANTDQFTGWTPQQSSWMFWNIDNLRNLEAQQDGNTVIFATGTEPPTVNPTGVLGGAAMQASKLQYVRLARWNSDGEAEPFAAESIEYVDDTTVDVELVPNLVCHDGEPFTAEDVQFTFEYFKEWGVPYLGSYYNLVDEVTVIDEQNLQFELARPTYSFKTVVSTEIPMIPKHIWDGVPEEHNLEHPSEWSDFSTVGAGPLELVNYEPQEQLVFEPFDDHPLVDFDFDTLIWNIYGDASSAINDVNQGNASFAQDLLPTQRERLEGENHLEIFEMGGSDMTSVFHNCGREPMQDRAFRQAVSEVINKQQIIEIVLRGRGEPAVTPISPSNDRYYNENVEGTYNGGLEAAINHLADAGYRWDEDNNLLKPINRFEESEDINPYGNPRGELPDNI